MFWLSMAMVSNFEREQKETGCPFHHNPITHSSSFSYTLITHLLSYLLRKTQQPHQLHPYQTPSPQTPLLLFLWHQFSFPSLISRQLFNAFTASSSIHFLMSIRFHPINSDGLFFGMLWMLICWVSLYILSLILSYMYI